MEPTQIQLMTACEAFGIAGGDPESFKMVKVAVRAAFATIPDPTVLADRWDSETDVKMGESTNNTLNSCADELRAFMRGEH